MTDTISRNSGSASEPLSRFYPPQGANAPNNSTATAPSERNNRAQSSYFRGRHPILLQRLYEALQELMDSYDRQSFLYDDYPDYLSLRLMRDRLLRENSDLTKDFLQEGCPILWLELLTDIIISEQLLRKRCG